MASNMANTTAPDEGAHASHSLPNITPTATDATEAGVPSNSTTTTPLVLDALPTTATTATVTTTAPTVAPTMTNELLNHWSHHTPVPALGLVEEDPSKTAELRGADPPAGESAPPEGGSQEGNDLEGVPVVPLGMADPLEVDLTAHYKYSITTTTTNASAPPTPSQGGNAGGVVAATSSSMGEIPPSLGHQAHGFHTTSATTPADANFVVPTGMGHHSTLHHAQAQQAAAVLLNQQVPAPSGTATAVPTLTVADPMGLGGMLSSSSAAAVGLSIDADGTAGGGYVPPSSPSSRRTHLSPPSTTHLPPHNTTTTRTHKSRPDFAFRLAELGNYKLQHGHCMVPHKYPPNPSLGTWVDTQRRRYRAFLRNPSKSTLTQSHVNQLLEVGFVFEPRKTRNETWNIRVGQLSEFTRANGHAHVREDDMTYPGLGKWVSYVRRQYRLQQQAGGKKKGKRLTEERIQQLRALGFVFEWKEAQALQRFREGVDGLRAFWSREGHTMVPKFYPKNATFGLVVEDMRGEYRAICHNLNERQKQIKEFQLKGDQQAEENLPPLLKGTGSMYMGKDIVKELASMGFLKEEGWIPVFYDDDEEMPDGTGSNVAKSDNTDSTPAIASGKDAGGPSSTISTKTSSDEPSSYYLEAMSVLHNGLS